MSSQIETVDLYTDEAAEGSATSASWSTTLESRYEPAVTPRLVGSAAAALLVLAGTSTALDGRLMVSDPGGGDVSSTSIQRGLVVGRRISRAEALQISRSILERAERERLALAELEAQRGIQWD